MDIPNTKPSMPLLCKLASIVVHADEMMSAGGHPFDRVALQGLIADPEVIEWLAAMDAIGMLPKKRNAP